MDLAAFKTQQRRWATGSMQTVRKLLPRIWRADLGLVEKVQATLHLTHYAVHPLMALIAVFTLPAVLSTGLAEGGFELWAVLIPFVLAMSGPTLLHLYAQRVLAHRLMRPTDLGLLTLFGVGIALSNTRAVIDAFIPKAREFVRTPKSGVIGKEGRVKRRYRAEADGLRGAEGLVAAYCLVSTVILLWAGPAEVAPFTLLDALAFAAVFTVGTIEQRT